MAEKQIMLEGKEFRIAVQFKSNLKKEIIDQQN
jgi:hypothetical protein